MASLPQCCARALAFEGVLQASTRAGLIASIVNLRRGILHGQDHALAAHNGTNFSANGKRE
jgi:hypothetical protein